jgi:hypothetical protein
VGFFRHGCTFQLDTMYPAVMNGTMQNDKICHIQPKAKHWTPSTVPLPSFLHISLMFIFQNVHCYYNLLILLDMERHTSYLHRRQLSWTHSAVAPISHRGYMLLQWTVVSTVAISTFNDLTAGAYNQQGSNIRVWR